MYLASISNGLGNADAMRRVFAGVPQLSTLLLPTHSPSPLANGLTPQEPINPQHPIGAHGKWLVEAIRQLHREIYLDPELHIVASLDDEPLPAVLTEIAAALIAVRCGEVPLGRIVGDNLTDALPELIRQGHPLQDHTSGETIDQLRQPILSAQVDFGAAPYVQALDEECRLLVGGTVSPGTLTVAATYHTAQLGREDWDGLALLQFVGALVETVPVWLGLEAGTAPTLLTPSGASLTPQTLPQYLALAQRALDPSGQTTRRVTADVTLDWEQVRATAVGQHEFHVHGLQGSKPSADYQVKIDYQLGYTVNLMAQIIGKQAEPMATELAREIAFRFPLTDNPFEKRGCWALLQKESDATQPWAGLRLMLFEQTRPALEKLLLDVHRALGQYPDVIVESPQRLDLQPNVATWYSTVPKSALSWDLEIRPARDWG